MASEFDKPASGLWNAADSVRAVPGKPTRNDSANIQISVLKGQSSAPKSVDSSAKPQSSKADLNRGFLPNNPQKDVLAAAIDVQWLLASAAVYGASSLPYQLAQSPTGSIPPFGLLHPFGLSVPGFPPVPVSPISPGTSSGQAVFTVNKPPERTGQRTSKQKPLRPSKKDSKSPSFVQSSSNLQSPIRHIAHTRYNQHTQPVFKESVYAHDKMGLKYPTVPGIKRIDVSKKGEFPNSLSSHHGQHIASSSIHNIPLFPQVTKTGNNKFLLDVSALAKHNKTLSPVRTPSGSSKGPQSASGFSLLNLNPSVSTPQQRNTSVSKSSKTLSGADMVSQNVKLQSLPPDKPSMTLVSKKLPTTTSLSQVNFGSQVSKGVAHMKSRSSLGDAEAAAILLGLRHGLGNSEDSPGKSDQRKSLQTKKEDNRKRSLQESSRYIPAHKRQRTVSAGQCADYSLTPSGAVDLSAKSPKIVKSRPPHAISHPAPHSGTNFANNTHVPSSNPVSLYHARKHGKNKNNRNDTVVMNSKYEETQQRYDLSAAGTVLADESSLKAGRHFLSPVRRSRDVGSSTSLVTHLPSYICAFDNPSQLEGVSVCECSEEMILKSQQAANNGGFNFKKVICKKFTQSMSTDASEVQYEQMPDCEDVFEGDGGHGIVFEPSLNLADGKNKPQKGIPRNTPSLSYSTIHDTKIPSIQSGSLDNEMHPLNSLTPTKQKAANHISVSRGNCDGTMPAREKSSERAIDFRVKKGSSVKRQKTDEKQLNKSITDKSRADKMPPTINVTISHSSACSQNVAPSVSSTSVPTSHSERSKAQNNSKISASSQASVVIAASAKKTDLSKSAPSFSELREKSKSQFRDNVLQGKMPSSTMTTFGSSSSRHKQMKDTTQRNLPVSNLYRVRNSALGDSNESLNSIGAESDGQGDDSDVMSDSSCTSCESGYSRTREGAISSGSDVDTDRDVSDTEDTEGTMENDTVRGTFSSSRPKFTLNRPKFTLNSASTFSDVRSEKPLEKATTNAISPPRNNIASTYSGTKIKIRKPTFTFSSEQQKTQSMNSASQSQVNSANSELVHKLRGDKTSLSKESSGPELKCDEGESERSFKAMLIKALNSGNQKEGLAVDGKSLRALVGEATCFYHNNKKYVLKRGLTKRKPKEGFIADVKESNGIIVSTKRDMNKNVTTSNDDTYESFAQSSIEPRVSVTAIKKKKNRKNKLKSKKRKKQHSFKVDSSKDRSATDIDEEKNADVVTGTVEHDPSSKQNGARGDVTHKRHRRVHEIENLIFEGAGGMTPLPDLSLRDSDVFTNIKLRRREAAKRGISEPNEDSNSNADSKRGRSSKAKERKRIQSAARERAVVNKSRKHSMEKKMKKYKRRNGIFLVKKVEPPEAPRSSCVRINAGVLRTHLEVQAFAAQEIRKFRKKSIRESDLHESETQSDAKQKIIDSVTVDGMRSSQKKEMSPCKLELFESNDGDLSNKTKINCGGENERLEPAEKFVGQAHHTNTYLQSNELFSKGDFAPQLVESKDDFCEVGKVHSSEEASNIPCSEVEEEDNLPLIEYVNGPGPESDKVSETSTDNAGSEPRYPKRLKAKREIEYSDRRKLGGDDQNEAHSDVTNCESDSVRSSSPYPGPSRSSRLRKRSSASSLGKGSSLSCKPKSSKYPQDGTTSPPNDKSNFSLLSFFPFPSAMTLGPALGDLQPSYSVMRLGPSRGHARSSWQVGQDAQETKQQLQREVWRNMTLDMFSNYRSNVNSQNSR